MLSRQSSWSKPGTDGRDGWCEMAEPEAFGVWLGRQLRRKGLSQSELAVELDVTRAAVSAWITGRAEPRMDKIQAIEEFLGLATGSTASRDEAPDSPGVISWYHPPA